MKMSRYVDLFNEKYIAHLVMGPFVLCVCVCVYFPSSMFMLCLCVVVSNWFMGETTSGVMVWYSNLPYITLNTVSNGQHNP